VAAAVRLLHRRHGWQQAARIGFISFVLAECACLYAASEGTPVPDWFEGTVLAVGALTLACFVTSVRYTSRVRHTSPAVLAHATPIAALHPAGPHAHHYPPRHRLTWYLRWIGMVLILGTSGGYTNADWPDVIPLNRTILVPEPAWRWGLGGALIDGDGTAVIAIAIGLLFQAAGVLVLIRMAWLAGNARRHRRARQQARQQVAGAPAAVA
jgi:hypothetical protein